MWGTGRDTNRSHDMPQLGGRDLAIAVLVEYLEGLFDFLFRVRVFHFTRHHRQELGEVDLAVAVRVDFVDHILQLCLCRILSKRTHHYTSQPTALR